MSVDPQQFLAAALGAGPAPSSASPPPPPPSDFSVDPQAFLQAALGPDPAEEEAKRRKLEQLQRDRAYGDQQAQALGLDQPEAGFLEQMGGVAQAIPAGGQQLLGGLGRILEATGQGTSQLPVPGAEMLGLPLQGIGETLSQGAEAYQRNNYEEELRRQEMAQQAPLWGFAQDVAAQVPQLAMAAGAGGGNLALPALGAASAGQGMQQAEQAGATPEQALAYGVTSGVIEAGTERFGKIPVVDKILKRAITGPAVRAGAVKRVLRDMELNFGQEAAASVGQRISQLATYDEQGSLGAKDLYNAVYEGLVGSFVGGGASAVSEMAQTTNAPQQAPAPTVAPPPVAEPIPVPEVAPLPPQPEIVPPAPPAMVMQEAPTRIETAPETNMSAPPVQEANMSPVVQTVVEEPAPEVTLYRGQPKEPVSGRILGKQRSPVQVIQAIAGQEVDQSVELAPFEYWSTSKEVSERYAKADEQILESMASRGVENPREMFLLMYGREPRKPGDVLETRKSLGKTLDLTGTSEAGELHRRLLDVESKHLKGKSWSELSREEKAEVEASLEEQIGHETEKGKAIAFPENEGGGMQAWRLLRNYPAYPRGPWRDANNLGTKVASWLRSRGFQSVAFDEHGEKNYALLTEATPPPAPPVQPEPVVPPTQVAPQEAQNAQAAQDQPAEARQPATPPEAPRRTPEARTEAAPVLGEAPDALRQQEGNQEGRQEVAPAPPVQDGPVPEAAVPPVVAKGQKGILVETNSGRRIPAPPQIRLKTNRIASSDLAKHNAWLREQAIAEAQANGNEFAADQFVAMNPKRMSQADKDLAATYLFGEETTYFDAATGKRLGNAAPAPSAAPAKGELGMATAATAAPYMQIPVSTAPPAAAQKPLGTQGVVSSLSKLWDVPVRFKHFRKRALAIFKTRPEVVRMREAGDLPAAAHEIAHYIDKTRPALVKGAHKAAADDLVALGKRLYSKGQHTRAFYESEGFAEYMRHRLTRDDAAQQAPEFDAYFNGAVVGDAELTKKLDESKALYDRWRGQAPIERAKGQIDFDQELGKLPAKERAVKVGRKAVSSMVNSWAPLDTFTQEMVDRVPGMKRSDLPAGSDPYRLLAAFQGSEASIARQMMLHGVRDAEGTVIAPPIKDAMSKVKADDYRDFFAYALAKRTIELEAKGKDTGLSVEDAREILAAHETPEWADAAKGLNAYANGLVDVLQGSGALTPEQAEKIKESEWYIPLTRVYEAESGGRLTSDYAGKQKQAAGGGEQPIQKLKGSTRPIQDPVLSLAQLTERVVNASTRAKVFRAVYGLQDAVEGAGDIIEEVDPPRVPTSFTLEKIRKQLEDMGIDVPADADGDALLTIFSNSAFPTGSDPIVTGVVNGERKFLYVKDPLLYQSLAHMPPPWLEATKMLWPLRKMASAVRLGATGLNPGFGLITNFIRDAWTGTLQTLTNPGSFVIRMARSAGKDTEADKLFYAGGGEMATPLGVDIKPFRKLKREIAAQTSMDEVMLRVRHPIDSLRDLIAFTETFGRRAEFRRVYDETLKKTGNKEDAWVAAQEAASEVTVNFRRAGIYGRALNQIIPFFNVAIQGPRAGVKAFQRSPGKAFLTATASLTIPALALYALHRDDEWYQEIPVWEKAIFLHFKVGNQVIRLPLPFEWGIAFATFPIAMLDQMRTKDKARFEETYGVMLDSLLPDTLPAGVRQAYEWTANRNLLTGREIESERLEQLLPEDRYYTSTSWAYKKIGKMLGLSPVKLQNTVEGLTGGLSRTLTDPLKAARAREAADIPVVGRLFSRQLRTGQSVSDIYTESAKAEQVYASILKALDEGKQKEIDRLEKKYADLLGLDPSGELVKGKTRDRYTRLYKLRDARKLLKEAKNLDDPAIATKIARVMLGRAKAEDLPPEAQAILEE